MTTATMTKPPRAGGRSPWGPIQDVTTFSDPRGAWFVGTAGHGGVKLSRALNATIPEAFRKAGGWYEEDCEWAIAGFFVPATRENGTGRPPVPVEECVRVLKEYFPDQWTQVFGEPVKPEESSTIRERIFREENKNNLVTVSAIGDKNDPNLVVVQAFIGGRREDGRYPNEAPRWFLIPAADYDTRGRTGFVVDPAKYEETNEARFDAACRS